MPVPKLLYFGSGDAQRVPHSDQVILEALGVEVVAFPGLGHGTSGLGDPSSPATDMVAGWLARNGWPGGDFPVVPRGSSGPRPCV